MAKISTYPNDINISINDKLIGTDNENSNATKNFPIGDIISLAESIIVPELSGEYVPYSGATSNVNLGSRSLSAGSITLGGLLISNGTSGSSGQVLRSSGTEASPQWVNVNTLITSNLYKGSFYDSITQTLTGGANVAIPVILRSTDSAATNGISIVSDGTNLTRITFANAGVYNILFSAQLANSGGTSQTVDFWLRKNGATAAANVPDSNGKVVLQSNANYLMAAWNYFINVNANDYVYLMWTATSTNITMVAAAANGVHPATPSIIVTANIV